MRLCSFGFILAVLPLLVSTSLAGVIRDDRDDSLYTSLASDPAYAAVGSVYWSESGGSYIGSGTLIGSEWVLTAAHVADGTDLAGGGNSNWRFTVGGATYYAEEFIIYPEWTTSGGDLATGADLALVRLTEDVAGVAPATLYDAGDEIGATATLVGFGSTGTGDEGYIDYSSGSKRAGQNAVDAAGGDRRVRGYDDRILFTDFDSPAGDSSTWGSSSALDLEYMTAPGDSGGGLFLEVDGVDYLAGVTSFGLTFDGEVDADYGDLGGYIRVSDFLDWIDDETGLISAQNAELLAGDYNLDGVVDAADYAIWRATLGENVVAGSGADGNGDGFIDDADYEIWRSNYGTDGGAADAVAALPVPAPSGLAAGCLGLMVILAKRTRVSPFH